MLTKQVKDENFLLQGSDAVSLGNRSPTFRAKILPLSALEVLGREAHWSPQCSAVCRLRKNGAVISLPHTPLWHAQRQIFRVK